jgi:hypothetical protein
VDPLVVTGRIGEEIDLILSDLVPGAVTEVIAHLILEPVDDPALT